MRATFLVTMAVIGSLAGFAALAATSTDTTPKKAKTAAISKAATKSHSTRATASHTLTQKTAIGKKGKKGLAHSAPVRASRQAAPSPERYKEIQSALVSKGYLQPEEANGQWGDGSSAALKRFQTDQNIEASGKINSLSLIALGLGPKHETAKPTSTAPATSSPAQSTQQP
jgi:putative peptidoglycan binding protein